MKPIGTDIDVSVCIPVFNEKAAVRSTVTELIEVMSRLPYTFEIVVIDDGSTDGSLDEIRDLPVRALRHRRNLGGGVARLTGLRHARGRWVLQTDADGTYPVDRVPAMLERMKNGADMVIRARRTESATDWHWLRVLMKWSLRWLAMTLALTTNQMQVDFEPIEYRPRTGRSSFRPIGDTYNYFLTIIRAMTYFDPLRIFITPATI